jgi:hypothetical protein
MVQARSSLPDKVIMYASVFSYNPRERLRINDYQLNESKIKQFECK